MAFLVCKSTDNDEVDVKNWKICAKGGAGEGGGVGVDAKITLLNKAYTSGKIHLE